MKTRTRKEMISFLAGHFRYNTMNSWNNSTSYAARVKIRDFVPRELQDAAYDLLECEDVYEEIGDVLRDFAEKYDYQHQICFNGRSGGYLVLIQGGKKLSEYKSYCRKCGQRNFQAIPAGEEAGVCGRCGAKERVNFTRPIYQYYTQPGLSMDQGEDFQEWTTDQLKDRVSLIKDFDKTVEAAKAVFIEAAKNGTHDEEYQVTKNRKVLN